MLRGNKLLQLSAALVLVGCATGGVNQQLDKKIAQENSVKSRNDLRADATQDLKTARMTPEQKAKFEKLRDAFTKQDNAIRDSSLKLRAVLVKDLLSTNYSVDEVDVIKNRMWDLENKRISLIYGAIDEANKILGHFQPEDQQLIDDFFELNHANR